MEHALYQPLGGNVKPRFGGIATMMRLPHVEDPAGLDVGFVGVPLDIGTSNRSGTRFGPRQIRTESVLLRPYNMATRAAPFDSLKVADLGDVALNPYSLLDSVRMIEEAYDRIYATGCKTISLGGDHTLTLPILRAMARHRGPVERNLIGLLTEESSPRLCRGAGIRGRPSPPPQDACRPSTEPLRQPRPDSIRTSPPHSCCSAAKART